MAWSRIAARDLARTQSQMEELHSTEDIADARFTEIVEFDKRQTNWYFRAFAGACPERAVYDAYWDGVLSDDDFSDLPASITDARDRYIATTWDTTSMSQIDTPQTDKLNRKERSLYID
ncbi:hypothetical protein [Rubripirellula obstinata]|uniref:hypothetical protein n=1 Tax=Rubripirellula obstinata TaxID=406547 RepID=UPI00122D3BDC|nr:hypothetical protein [Rubripirellula obstinata]